MFRRIFISMLLAASSGAMAGEHLVPAEEWLRPRSAERVLAMEPVREAVREWRAWGGRITIVHASGETGSLWASELRDWLIALGLPADAIGLRPGGTGAGLLLVVAPEDDP